jgi:hypothetical protein
MSLRLLLLSAAFADFFAQNKKKLFYEIQLACKTITVCTAVIFREVKRVLRLL